ncbi:hypothetical protein I4U23_018243 [Adineta vaga]|nr:hypothetical protein I4U23_018243 [Adineta vaga]
MSKHIGIRCDGCNAFEFSDYRYKCQICPNYNLCLMCYNNKKQTSNHLYSHLMLQINPPPSVDPNLLTEQHTGQMNNLGESYLSKFLSNISVNNIQAKASLPSTKTLDKFSVDELYDYLLRIDPTLYSLADKLKNERVSGFDLVNFNENDYQKFSITYGEKKKLELLIERKQAYSNSQSSKSDLTDIQNEITQLKTNLQKKEQEIEEKNETIHQLESIIEKQDQQTQIQDAIIKQLQETLEKQTEDIQMMMKLMQEKGLLPYNS